MKLSKLLLGAILAGVTVQTTTSCNKAKYQPVPYMNAAENNGHTNDVLPVPGDPGNCPACGMG